MPPKRLVLFVEGEGEEQAAPILVKQLITELDGWDCLFLDPAPFRVGGVTNLFGKKAENWTRYLAAASRRKSLGGVLLLQYGDVPLPGESVFCPRTAGSELAQRARRVAEAGQFSVACVFAVQEYESWLMAGVESLAGKRLPDGREGVFPGTTAPPNVEVGPRDAKGWLSQRMAGGYAPTTDQAPLTSLVDLAAIRQRELRSFRRLETALATLIRAFRDGQCVVSPE